MKQTLKNIVTAAIFICTISINTMADDTICEAQSSSNGYKFIKGYTIQTRGMVQIVASINEKYQGKPVWVIGERYGETMLSGYGIYLTSKNPKDVNPSWTNCGQVRVFTHLQENPQTYAILAPNIDPSKNCLATIPLSPVP